MKDRWADSCLWCVCDGSLLGIILGFSVRFWAFALSYLCGFISVLLCIIISEHHVMESVSDNKVTPTLDKGLGICYVASICNDVKMQSLELNLLQASAPLCSSSEAPSCGHSADLHGHSSVQFHSAVKHKCMH